MWIAVVLAIAATLPQLYQTFSTGLVRDHHPWSPLLAMLANVFLVFHGYTRKDYGLMLFGLWFVFFNGVLAYYKHLAPASTE